MQQNAPEPALLAAPPGAPAIPRREWARPADGVYYGMAAEEYHAVEAMSSSGIPRILRSPQHYVLARTEPGEATDAMDFGTAVHCGILEPGAFASRVVTRPAFNRYTKQGKLDFAAFVAANAGKITLTDDDAERVCDCIAAIRANPTALRLLEPDTLRGIEVSVFWHDREYGVPCKARFDAVTRVGIVDLKTAADASADAFGKAAERFFYHVQAAHYSTGYEFAFGSRPGFFVWIVAESDKPHGVACYYAPAEVLALGARLAVEAYSRYRDALNADRWPGYPERIAPLAFPRWALKF